MKPWRMSVLVVLLLPGVILSGAAASADINRLGVEAFNRGDYAVALARFEEALRGAPSDPAITANYVAACRSLAAVKAKQSDGEGAAAVLRKGAALLPANSDLRRDLTIVLVNNGVACLNRRDAGCAQAAVTEALRLDPENAAAYCLSGDIAFGRHDLTSAEVAWKRALGIEPANRDIATRLERVRREVASERTYSQTNAYSFDIRFDYKALSNGIIDLRENLMQAYEKAGREFNRFPDYPIVVILSDDNTFRMVNNAPAWVAGLYDGKIRIPVNFSRIPAKTLRSIVAHEYTHALISDLAGGNCPVWLNEGLAMHEMDNPSLIATNHLRQALGNDRMLSMAQLAEQQLVWRNPAIVNLAYAQSWIMAEYLLSRWSAAQVKSMLEAMKRGASFESIMQTAMNRTPEQFEEEWKAFARECRLLNP